MPSLAAEAKPDNLIEELAEIYEVMDAILANLEIDKEPILAKQEPKRQEKGRFTRKLRFDQQDNWQEFVRSCDRRKTSISIDHIFGLTFYSTKTDFSNYADLPIAFPVFSLILWLESLIFYH